MSSSDKQIVIRCIILFKPLFLLKTDHAKVSLHLIQMEKINKDTKVYYLAAYNLF